MVASKSDFLGAEPDGNAEKLGHFAGIGAADVAAQHAVGFAVHHQLHQHALVAARQRVLHGAEAGFVDIDLGIVLAGLGFGQANGADFRLGENRGWNERVIGLHILAAEDIVGKGLAFADGDGRQVHAVGDIAHGIDIVRRGARIVIDLHGIVRREINAGIFQAQIHDIGKPARGKHDLAGAEGRAIFQGYANSVAALFDLRNIGAGADFNALLLHFGAEVGLQIFIEAAQDLFAAVDQNGFNAEALERFRRIRRRCSRRPQCRCGAAVFRGGRPRWR